MTTAADRQLAAKQVLDTLRRLGRTDLFKHLWVDWMHTERRLGDALYAPPGAKAGFRGECYRQDGVIARVRFSERLWDRATEEEREATVVHEVAHLVTCHEAHLAGRKIPSPHGREWKLVMLRAGAKPERTHSVRSRLDMRATCLCQEHWLRPRHAGAILVLGHTLRCNSCKGQLIIDTNTATQEQIRAAKMAGLRALKRTVRR